MLTMSLKKSIAASSNEWIVFEKCYNGYVSEKELHSQKESSGLHNQLMWLFKSGSPYHLQLLNGERVEALRIYSVGESKKIIKFKVNDTEKERIIQEKEVREVFFDYI